ncbi:hypothetical protein CHARACLAT_021360, partial [Characodon lateralis]|nr:hypothetical protein [Characodon lateralis]
MEERRDLTVGSGQTHRLQMKFSVTSRSADAGSCHEVKIAYMMRQIGPVELVPERPGTGEPLRVCVHTGPSCCTSKMEDSYMAAVRSEMQHKMRSYSSELKYLIEGHKKAYQ